MTRSCSEESGDDAKFHFDDLARELEFANMQGEAKEIFSDALIWFELALRRGMVSGLFVEWNIGDVWIGYHA